MTRYTIAPMVDVCAAGLAVADARDDWDRLDRILDRAEAVGALHDIADVLARLLAAAVQDERTTIAAWAARFADTLTAAVEADAAAGEPFGDGPAAVAEAARMRDYAARTEPAAPPAGDSLARHVVQRRLAESGVRLVPLDSDPDDG